MINADSILSMFTDRFTLLKYLQVLDKDVQKLLEKAVTSISVDKVPDTTDEYTLTINFEDGTSETTPAFVIEQGEDGRGISLIAKTGTAGNVDTFTITYTDGTTSTYTVNHGTALYKHATIIELKDVFDNDVRFELSVINNVASQNITYEDMEDFFNNAVFLSGTMTNSNPASNDKFNEIFRIQFVLSQAFIYVYGVDASNNFKYYNSDVTTYYFNVTDVVTPL